MATLAIRGPASASDHVDRLLTLVEDARPGAARAVEEAIAAVITSVKSGAVFVGYLDYEQELFWIVDAAGEENFGLRPGRSLPIAESFCLSMVEGWAPRFCNDVAAHPVYGPLSVQAGMGCGSFLGVPLQGSDDQAFGGLCAVERSAYAFTMAHHDLFARAAQVLSHALHTEHAEATRAALRAVLLGSLSAPDSGQTRGSGPVPRLRPVSSTSAPVAVAVGDSRRRAEISAAISARAGISLAAVTGDGDAALRHILDERPEVALITVDLAGKNGLDVLHELTWARSRTRVVLMSETVTSMVCRPARSLPTRTTIDEVCDVIVAVVLDGRRSWSWPRRS